MILSVIIKRSFMIAALASCILNFTSCVKRNELTCPELSQLLGIERWIVPMPKDTRYEWAFEFRDYKEGSIVKGNEKEWADSSRKAEIVFMPTGLNNIYRFWLKQKEGTSSGEMRVDVCENPDDTSFKCDYGQIEIKWFHPPLQIEDGKKYLIGEVKETFEPGRRKQIILHLTKFRLEDMMQDKK